MHTINKAVLFLIGYLCSAGLFGQTGQIAIGRVDLMPDQPAPYELRDWKNVAIRYDSFASTRTKRDSICPW